MVRPKVRNNRLNFSIPNLTIEPSTEENGGKGLFTQRPIAPNTLISTFEGPLMSSRNVSPEKEIYALKIKEFDLFIDGQAVRSRLLRNRHDAEYMCNSGVALFVNSSLHEPNCYRVDIAVNDFHSWMDKPLIAKELSDILPPYICLVTLRTVQRFEELKWNYATF
jgi:hypothetical protein